MKGGICDRRHVHECPDYAATGLCQDMRCRLPHVDRAGQIKKHATTMVEKPARFGQEEDSDLSSAEEDYEELNTDDVDSDAFEDDMIDPSKGVENHAIAQQRDFVQF